MPQGAAARPHPPNRKTMSQLDSYTRKLIKRAEEGAINDLVEEKVARVSSNVAKNSYEEKIASLRALGSTLSKAALYQRVNRAFKNKSATPVAEVSADSGSEVSGLSSAPPVDLPSSNADTPRIQVGRPKGSTNKKKAEDAQKEKDCVNDITYHYATELTARKAEGKRVAKGFLDALIKEKKKEFGVGVTIDLKMIQRRVQRKSLAPKHRGAVSPLQAAEMGLVAICIQMGNIRQPLSCSEGISLMQDLIKDTQHQEAVREFQKSRKLGSEDFQYGTLSRKWWKGFLRRNSDQIVTRRGEKFACSRADWTKRSNLEQMFNVVYDEMVDAGIAIHLQTPVFTDCDGNEVDESEKVGYAQDIKITHKHYLLFADECGCSTSQKKDGQVGGTKFIVKRGTVPQQIASTNDHNFTLLPFTSASGEVVCCVIIFKSLTGQVPLNWASGVDIRVGDPVLDDSGDPDMNLNKGEGRYYPGGPKCHYNGKVVDCLTFASESGGIDGKILVKILQHFDKIELFPRPNGADGPFPMVIVDGHQSRYDPGFVDYINDKEHRWKVCLGVPYATSLWQVGDASQQNGKFKTEWYREKNILLKWKIEHNLPRSIVATDIVPLLNRIFSVSYGTVASNKHAVCERGWFPPNRMLLDHPSLSEEGRSTPSADSASANSASANSASTPTNSSVVQLNLNEGTSASILDTLLDHRMKADGAKKAAEERKRKGEKIADNLRKAKKLSSGVLIPNGIYSLDDERFLEVYNEKRQEATQKKEKSASDKRGKIKKLIRGVKALREQHGHESTHRFEPFGKDQCGVYLQYKKKSAKDPGMPKDVKERRQRCLEWMGRQSPTISPHASDDEGDDNPFDPAAVAGSLLALANVDVTHDEGGEEGDGGVGVEEDGDNDSHAETGVDWWAAA